jgi:hypothetical protein
MFFKRKEIWVPTWKGWLAMLAGLAAALFFAIRVTAPFLSPTQPVGAPVLVVEGWLSEAGVRSAIKLAEQNHYALIITTGVDIDKGLDISHYENYAKLGAARFQGLGYTGTNLVAVPAPPTRKDRTYNAALKLHDYLLQNTNYRSIDLISDSVHARRSWLLFDKACRPDIKVGIIANDNPDFDAKHWWRSSNGVRTVLSEVIAYFYARLLFHPG